MFKQGYPPVHVTGDVPVEKTTSASDNTEFLTPAKLNADNSDNDN